MRGLEACLFESLVSWPFCLRCGATLKSALPFHFQWSDSDCDHLLEMYSHRTRLFGAVFESDSNSDELLAFSSTEQAPAHFEDAKSCLACMGSDSRQVLQYFLFHQRECDLN
jgi:hypothetical protein